MGAVSVSEPKQVLILSLILLAGFIALPLTAPGAGAQVPAGSENIQGVGSDFLGRFGVVDVGA